MGSVPIVWRIGELGCCSQWDWILKWVVISKRVSRLKLWDYLEKEYSKSNVFCKPY